MPIWRIFRMNVTVGIKHNENCLFFQIIDIFWLKYIVAAEIRTL